MIGFSFGIAGPCLLSCSPVLITYVAGSGKRLAGVLKDIFVFLSGRLSAYIILGAVAGASGALLKTLSGPAAAAFFRPLGGAVAVFFGIIVLFDKGYPSCECVTPRQKAFNYGGLFALGFAVGMMPCAPLVALLFEIALMSRGAFDGAAYASSFGIGTFLSGMAVVGATAGILTWVPARMLKSREGIFTFRIICAGLLILTGIILILRGPTP
jgi:sulfite exporter TauE/SafE